MKYLNLLFDDNELILFMDAAILAAMEAQEAKQEAVEYQTMISRIDWSNVGI